MNTLRFALFAGEHRYPSGGWDDWRGSFATQAEALTAAADAGHEWWHVVDLAAVPPAIVTEWGKR